MKKVIWVGFLVWSFFVFTSCTKTEEQSAIKTSTTVSTSTSTSVTTAPDTGTRKCKTFFKNGEWVFFLDEALALYGQDMLKVVPKDVAQYINDFENVDRKSFYAALLSKLVEFESSYNPNASYTEKFPDSKGNRVVSRGLFQLSQESANGYGCGITKAEQLYNPETNIKCAVRICNRWVSKDGVIKNKVPASENDNGWRGCSRYWSPFRDPVKLAKIQASVKEACK